MPTFNLSPILFPKAKQDDVYDMMKDYLQIKERQIAIGEGGEIRNPSSYNSLIQEYQAISNDPSVNANDRRDAQKMVGDLTIKQLKADLDQKKRTDSGDLKQMVEQDLRELEFEFPNNPIAYSTGAMMKYNDILYGTSEREGLNQLIETLDANAVDITSLREYQIHCQEELSKFSDIMDAYEVGDMRRLSEYAVVYTPYAGKVKAMQIIFRGDTNPSHSQRANMSYTKDMAGNVIMAPDSVGIGGMQVYFVRANVSNGDKYVFGNNEFSYTEGIGWNTKKAEAFDLRTIRHAPLHSIPSGSFAKDSKGKLYYVNRDRSFFPVSEQFKGELGFSEDKVYNLSPDEEINSLPGAIDHTTFPVIERYNREASMNNFNYWNAFKEELGVTVKKKVPEFFGKIEAGIKEGAKKAAAGFWEVTKEGLRKGVEGIGQPKQPIPEKPGWGLREAVPTKLIEEGKKFIETLSPKY